MPRRLIETTANHRRYEVTNDAGLVIGEDLEPIFSGRDLNRLNIESRARQALTVNAAFLAITTPTAVQTTAQVKALTRQMNALIRLITAALDEDPDAT